MQQRLVVAREEVAKASLKAEEAKRLERTEAALLHNAGGKPEQIAASTAAELENGAIGVALAALAAYRQQDDQSVDETRRQSAVERLAAARKRAEARKRAASEAASQAAATASRVDLTKGDNAAPNRSNGFGACQNTKEESYAFNEARKRAEERRSAERAALRLRRTSAASQGDLPGEESVRRPRCWGHPAWLMIGCRGKEACRGAAHERTCRGRGSRDGSAAKPRGCCEAT